MRCRASAAHQIGCHVILLQCHQKIRGALHKWPPAVAPSTSSCSRQLSLALPLKVRSRRTPWCHIIALSERTQLTTHAHTTGQRTIRGKRAFGHGVKMLATPANLAAAVATGPSPQPPTTVAEAYIDNDRYKKDWPFKLSPGVTAVAADLAVSAEERVEESCFVAGAKSIQPGLSSAQTKKCNVCSAKCNDVSNLDADRKEALSLCFADCSPTPASSTL